MTMPLADAFVRELTVNAAGRWLLVSVAAMLGAVLGSFLNVVAYRLPRGMSLSRPGSQCPVCHRSIRWYDNVPVIGWIRLGGRCRDCGAPISPRYPAVEAFMAAIGGLLAWKASTVDMAHAVIAQWYRVDVAWWAYHVLLMCTLVAAALIKRDGGLPPLRLLGASLVGGLAMSWLWPSLVPPSELFGTSGPRGAIDGMVTALLVGAAPWLAWYIKAQRLRTAYANAALAQLVVVGGFLGGAAVMRIAVAGMGLYTLVELLTPRWPAAGRFGWAGPLAAVTLSWVLVWPDRLLFDLGGSNPAALRLIAAMAATAALAAVLEFAPTEQGRA